MLTPHTKNRTRVEEAYITRVRKNAVNVLVPAFGLEGPVYFDGLSDDVRVKLEYDDETMSLTVTVCEQVRTCR